MKKREYRSDSDRYSKKIFFAKNFSKSQISKTSLKQANKDPWGHIDHFPTQSVLVQKGKILTPKAPWFSMGFFMGLHGVLHEAPWGSPWGCMGFSMGLHGAPWGSPWRSMGFSMGFPMSKKNENFCISQQVIISLRS